MINIDECEFGLGFFSTKKIQPFKTIYKESPLVAVVNQAHLNAICSGCFESGPLKRCSGCKALHYCSIECQRKDYPLHKLECPLLSRVPPTFSRLLLRLVLLERVDPKGYKDFNQLIHHKDKLSLTSMEQLIAHVGVVKSLVKVTPQVLEMAARIHCNAMSIESYEANATGVGVYLKTSRCNHSCQPNAHVVFYRGNLTLRSLVPISQHQQIFISYGDCADLLEQFHFSCDCIPDTTLETLQAQLDQDPFNTCMKLVEFLSSKYTHHPLLSYYLESAFRHALYDTPESPLCTELGKRALSALLKTHGDDHVRYLNCLETFKNYQLQTMDPDHYQLIQR